jgi:hypothetical protein
MSWPKAPTSLDDSCSVIYENILYSFTPEAFLSLCKMEEAGDGRESFGGRLCWGDPR